MSLEASSACAKNRLASSLTCPTLVVQYVDVPLPPFLIVGTMVTSGIPVVVQPHHMYICIFESGDVYYVGCASPTEMRDNFLGRQ